MKKKFALVTATAVTALLLFVGCGVKVTNISVPDAATIEKGESITLPVNFGTEDVPAETPVIVTGESATAVKNGDGAVVLTTCTVLFL